LISAVMASRPFGIGQPSHLNQPGFHPDVESEYQLQRGASRRLR
jgi:hypothetical protein